MLPMVKDWISKLPIEKQLTWGVRGGSLFKIPLLALAWPEVLEISHDQSRLKIPLSYRTKNHMNVVYFGALCMGAEAVVALHVLDDIRQNGKIDFLFKDFKANFLKRAESDVIFVCQMGHDIREMVKKARESKERQTLTFQSYALTPYKTGDEKVAEFQITLSVKAKSK